MKVSDKVIQSLYQLIEQQGMKVGDRLASERKLCEQLGVSRSSLREALQQLNTQGIVQSRLEMVLIFANCLLPGHSIKLFSL